MGDSGLHYRTTVEHIAKDVGIDGDLWDEYHRGQIDVLCFMTGVDVSRVEQDIANTIVKNR